MPQVLLRSARTMQLESSPGCFLAARLRLTPINAQMCDLTRMSLLFAGSKCLIDVVRICVVLS